MIPRRSQDNYDPPSARTVIRAIALAKGVGPGREYYLTKLQMIALCRKWLELNSTGAAAIYIQQRASE